MKLFRKEVLELCARKNRGLAVKDATMSIKNSDFRQHDFLSQGFHSFSVSIYTHVSQSTESPRRKPRNIKKKEKEKEKKQVYLWLTNPTLHLQNRPA
jgi:CRISPR/Cas system-associated protein endoribonuclease Cas2